MNDYFLKKLKKAFKARGTWYPEESDPDGLTHPEVSNRVKTTASNGKPVWRYDNDTSDRHEQMFMNNYQRFARNSNLSRNGHNLLLSAIKRLVRDPDKHVIGSGTSNHPDPNHKELRLRHLSMAMNGSPGYSIFEQDGNLHIKAPRHSKRRGSEGGYSHWTWNGNEMSHKEIKPDSSSQQKRPIRGIIKRGLDERANFETKTNSQEKPRLEARDGTKHHPRQGTARGRRPREFDDHGSILRGSRLADSVAKSLGQDLVGDMDRYWSLVVPRNWYENSPILIKSISVRTEGRKFVSLDGDNIGASVERAAMADDLDTIVSQSEKIADGQKVIRDWAKKHQADIYIDGGDDIAFTLPEKHIKDLEDLKESYAKVTGFTVTIGVGDTISRAGHAMLFGKLNGKNQINDWSPEVDKKLAEISRKMTPEEKLADHNLLPGGKGDKLKPSDVDRDQLKQGIKVEMEHTDDPRKAVEIALDHLAEDPEYYTKLATIEPEHGKIEKNQDLKNRIRSIANQYAQSKGLKIDHNRKTKVNPEKAKNIAQAYHGMKHDPNNPHVKQAYDALINETMDQFQHLKNSGMRFSRITPDMENPYPGGSKDLFRDLHENNHIWYYPTESGFGSNEEQGSDHPLLQETGMRHEGKPLLANDVFRIVHDVFGHAKEGTTFGPHGEENAWEHHMQMYTPLAQKALTSETRGQNSWVNFGPHGEHNRANPHQTIYADQKAGLLPDWAMESNVESNLNKKEDSDYIDLVHFGQKPGLTSLSPSYQGTAKQGREGKSIETSRYLLDAQNKKYNKSPYLHTYIANTGDAEPIFQSAPAKYHIRLPKDKIYDLSRDPEGILRNIKEEHSDVYAPNEHPMSHPDLVHSAIKDAGYLGWRVGNHPDERFRDAVMFYHDIPVVGKDHDLYRHDPKGHTGIATEISRNPESNWASTDITKR